MKDKKQRIVHTRKGRTTLDDLPSWQYKVKQLMNGWTPNHTKVLLYSTIALGLISTGTQTMVTRAESQRGTKTKDQSQATVDVFVTNTLNQPIASLTVNNKEVKTEVTKEDFKEIKDEEPEIKAAQEVFEEVQPQKELLEVQVLKIQEEIATKTILEKPVIKQELGVINLVPPQEGTAQPDTAQPDTAQPDTAQPDTAQPDTTEETETPVTDKSITQEEIQPKEETQPQEPTYITLVNEQEGLIYFKETAELYYKELQEGVQPLGQVLTHYTLPTEVKNSYAKAYKRLTVGQEDVYYFTTMTGLQGYIAVDQVEFEAAPVYEEIDSIKDRDFIQFDTEGLEVSDTLPFRGKEGTNFTIKKDTRVHIDKTIEITVPRLLQRFVLAETIEGQTVYIPEASVTLTDDKLSTTEGTVIGYTSTDMKTKVDLDPSNLVYQRTTTEQTPPGKLTYYEFKLKDQEGVFYVSDEKVIKQHYGFADTTAKDERIYRLNITSEVRDKPKGYKDSNVQDTVAIGKYVKALNKLKVTNTDDTSTDWVEIQDNGLKLGYIEASKLTEMEKELTVKATAIDTFKVLAETYQLEEDQLKLYNPEIALFGEPSNDELIYLYARSDLTDINKKYSSLDTLFNLLELEDKDVQREMIELQGVQSTSKSTLVQEYHHLIPYIKYRGFLPSVTFGQAIHESGDGGSGLARSDRNLFGIKGSYKGSGSSWSTGEVYSGNRVTINATFRSYPTIEDSFKDYLDLLENNYNVKGITDPRSALIAVQAGGYATDPSYVSSNMSTIDTYGLTELDK